MKINMMKIKEDLGISGEDLLTRVDGQRFYHILINKISNAEDRSLVELEFSGIKTLDISFCDECLAKLIHKDIFRNKFGACILIVRDLESLSAIENFHAALDYYRKVCCFILNKTTSVEHIQNHVIEKLHSRFGTVDSQYFYLLLGSLEQNLFQVLKYIIQHREATARTIADGFGLNINTASTRLLKLYQKHLIYRKEEVSSEGRQYIYRSPF